MIVLGIDTSTDIPKVALVKASQIWGEITQPVVGQSLELLVPTIDDLLQGFDFQIQDVDLLSVVVGPGSWSGLRIGVSAMKVLSHVTNIPIVGIPSLDALAFNLRYVNQPVYVAMNARDDSVFCAEYDCSREVPVLMSEYMLKGLEEFAHLMKPSGIIVLHGDDRSREILRGLVRAGATIAPAYLGYLRPAAVAEAGQRRFLDHSADDAATLAPLYLQEFKTGPIRSPLALGSRRGE